MHLGYRAIPQWPALAWLARLRAGADHVQVLHGPRVEARDQWFCEAIWDGDFAQGDFDRTDRVFGSGARLRDSTIVFVSSGTTVDRLQWMQIGDELFVSNSLACLLSHANADVDPTFARYQRFFGTVLRGIDEYDRELPTTAGPARLAYFRNLRFDGKTLVEEDKPHSTDGFKCFHDYRDYLAESVERMGKNLGDSRRKAPFRMLGTISSGYDSACVAALWRAAGLERAITLSHGKRGRPDSGERTAQALNIELTQIQRDAWRDLHCPEAPFASSDAKGEDVYFAGAGELLSGCVLITGFQGGKTWEKQTDLSGSVIRRSDRSGLSLTEYRLHTGFIHCPLPFLGSRRIDEIVRISNCSEMSPWDSGGHYTKPIARRILEEAGVPGDAYGREKIAASVVFHSARDMLSPSTQAEFLAWLDAHSKDFWRRGAIPPHQLDALLRPLRWVARRGWSVYARSRHWPAPMQFVPTISRRCGEWADKERISFFLFPWAMHRAKQAYAAEAAASRVSDAVPGLLTASQNFVQAP